MNQPDKDQSAVEPAVPEAAEPQPAAAGGGTPSADPAVQAALEKEVAELKDALLRAHADMENLRRRAERDREDVHKFAISRFARDLLSVADNLRRALDSAPQQRDEALQNLVAGVEVTERELLGTLERHQVVRVVPLGERFDPNFHEAVFEVEDPSKPSGTIVQVMAPGYTIAGRLLRAAMVGVSKGGPREASATAKVDTTA